MRAALSYLAGAATGAFVGTLLLMIGMTRKEPPQPTREEPFEIPYDPRVMSGWEFGPGSWQS